MHPTTTNLNSEEFAALLKKLDVCQEGRDWSEGKDLATAWTTCHRSDWLLWLLNKAAPLDSITNELLVCRFAREVVHLTPDPRVLACIETREAWARGEVSDEVRDAARDAACEATRITAGFTAESPALAAAESAAMAAVEAATGNLVWASTRAAAYAAVGDAAYAAVGNAVVAAARAAAGARQADIIRELVPMPVLA